MIKVGVMTYSTIRYWDYLYRYMIGLSRLSDSICEEQLLWIPYCMSGDSLETMGSFVGWKELVRHSSVDHTSGCRYSGTMIVAPFQSASHVVALHVVPILPLYIIYLYTTGDSSVRLSMSQWDVYIMMWMYLYPGELCYSFTFVPYIGISSRRARWIRLFLERVWRQVCAGPLASQSINDIDLRGGGNRNGIS